MCIQFQFHITGIWAISKTVFIYFFFFVWRWRCGCGRGESLWSIEAVCHSSLMLSITECSWKQSPLWRALGKWMHCWLPVTTHNTKAQLFTLGSACGDIILSPGKKKKKERCVIKMSLKRAWAENAAHRTSKMVLLDVCRETYRSSLAPLTSVSTKAKGSFCLFSFALSFLFIFSTVLYSSCVSNNWLRTSRAQILRSPRSLQVKN